MLAAEIHPSPNRPHYLSRLRPEGGVYIRVGSTNRRADPVIIQEMQRYQLAASFDEQPIPELNSEKIAFRVASEYSRPIRKLTRQSLESLKVTAV